MCMPLWRVHGTIHSFVSPQSAWEKFTFSSLTLCGHDLNYSMRRLASISNTKSRGILFKAQRYFGHGELDFIMVNHFFGAHEHPKVGPKGLSNYSSLRFYSLDFPIDHRAEKMFDFSGPSRGFRKLSEFQF